MSNLNQIEEKLYKANFKNNFLRQQSYLAVHSALIKNKEVPRAYIPSHLLSDNEIDTSIAILLLSDPLRIVENTNKFLTNLNISTKQLNSLSSDENEELISLIDDLLLNGWGRGVILYDNLRISPTNKCSFLELLLQNNVQNNEKYLPLIKKLQFRLSEGIKSLEDLNKVFPKGERRYDPTILSKSYQLILEKIWRTNWNNNLNYMVLPEDQELLSKLIFMEEI